MTGTIDHVVVVVAARRLALALGDADDAERDVLDAHALADRIGAGAEQLLGDGLAEHGDLGAGVDVLGGDAAAQRGSASCGSRRTPGVVPVIGVAQFWSADDLAGGVQARRHEAHAAGPRSRMAFMSSQVSVGCEPAPTLAPPGGLRARRARSAGWCPSR